jgi:hypothetical protein
MRGETLGSPAAKAKRTSARSLEDVLSKRVASERLELNPPDHALVNLAESYGIIEFGNIVSRSVGVA